MCKLSAVLDGGMSVEGGTAERESEGEVKLKWEWKWKLRWHTEPRPAHV